MKPLTLIILTTLAAALAADVKASGVRPKDDRADPDSPSFVPLVKVGKTLVGKDSVKYVEMNNVYVYAPVEFKNDKQRRAYDRLVHNVKRTLPIAKEVNRAILETYEYMETLPDEEARKEHMRLVEQSLKADYTPRLKRLSLTQGKLLIQLVYRETDSSGYDLVRAFLGTGKAVFYQAFAWMFGASLRKDYQPEGRDKMIERVVRLVEAGQL